MAARQQLGFPVYNPQLGKDGYGYLVPPLNPAALVDGAEDQSAQPSRGGFGEGAGSLLSAIGLALMSSPRNAPLSNLANILPGVMQAQQSRAKQQQVFDLVKGLGNNGPPMPGMEDAAPGAALPLAQGTPGAAGMAANPVPVSPVADIASPAQYAPLIQQAAANNGIDPQTLTKLIATESNFNPNAKSPAGAGGIAQFMPATAQRFGIDPYKPEQAIPAAAQYVAQNKEMFGGNLGLALAGYNWGEGNVRKWLIGGASPDRMPLETRNYVQKITGQPIEGWLNGGGTAAPAGQAQPVQMAQADSVIASDAAPGPREIAQARAAMPRTAPPTSPDAVSGARTQQVTAQRYFDHWSRVMGAASMLGQEGKGLMEAAKLRAEFALKFMTPTEQQRNAEIVARSTGQDVGQVLQNMLPNNSPEHAAAIARANKGVELQYAPALKSIDVQGNIAQAQGTPTNTMKEAQVYQYGSPEEQAALERAQAGNRASTTINNATNPIVTGIGKRFDDQATRATSAANSIRSMHMALDLVNAGMISGPGANERAFLQRAGELFGLPAEGAANTAAFQSAMGENVLETVKQLGSGVSISNADREFAAKMAGGSADLGEASIRRIIQIREDLARQVIDQYNKQVDKLIAANPDDTAMRQVIPLMRVDTPPHYQPKTPQAQSGTPVPVGKIPEGKAPIEYSSAVEALRLSPTKTNRYYFDQIFGKGAAARELGN